MLRALLVVLLVSITAPERASAQGGAPTFASSAPVGVTLVATKGRSGPSAAEVRARVIAPAVSSPVVLGPTIAQTFRATTSWLSEVVGSTARFTVRSIPGPIPTLRVEAF